MGKGELIGPSTDNYHGFVLQLVKKGGCWRLEMDRATVYCTYVVQTYLAVE